MKSMHDHRGEIRAARRKLVRAMCGGLSAKAREYSALLKQREDARLKAFRRMWGVPDEPIRMVMRVRLPGECRTADVTVKIAL